MVERGQGARAEGQLIPGAHGPRRPDGQTAATEKETETAPRRKVWIISQHLYTNEGVVVGAVDAVSVEPESCPSRVEI